jgi:hypothetical protein
MCLAVTPQKQTKGTKFKVILKILLSTSSIEPNSIVKSLTLSVILARLGVDTLITKSTKRNPTANFIQQK